jgi:hypothetical protein
LEETVKRLLIALSVLGAAAPALAQTSLLPTVQRIRAEYPTPMSPAQRGELLNRVAWEHRAEGWGLLRKTSGNRCPAPQGVEVACDILVYAPNPWHFDVLIDSEGAAIPTWGDVGPCDPSVSGCDMARFLAPVGQPGQPPPPVQTSGMVGGDFDGNGLGDLLVQTPVGTVTLGLNTGSVFQTHPVFTSATPWALVGVGNFDNMGYPDVVWQHPSGAVVLWTLNTSTTPTSSLPLFSGTSTWRVVAVADVDLDSNADLIWQSPTGQVIVWFMQGQNLRSSHELWTGNTDWRIVTAADLNGDGNADLVWQNAVGQAVVWLMQGVSHMSSALLFGGSTTWRIVAAADLDGSGQRDLVWRDPANNLVVWTMTGVSQTGTLFLRLNPDWRLSSSP